MNQARTDLKTEQRRIVITPEELAAQRNQKFAEQQQQALRDMQASNLEKTHTLDRNAEKQLIKVTKAQEIRNAQASSADIVAQINSSFKNALSLRQQTDLAKAIQKIKENGNLDNQIQANDYDALNKILNDIAAQKGIQDFNHSTFFEGLKKAEQTNTFIKSWNSIKLEFAKLIAPLQKATPETTKNSLNIEGTSSYKEVSDRIDTIANQESSNDFGFVDLTSPFADPVQEAKRQNERAKLQVSHAQELWDSALKNLKADEAAHKNINTNTADSERKSSDFALYKRRELLEQAATTAKLNRIKAQEALQTTQARIEATPENPKITEAKANLKKALVSKKSIEAVINSVNKEIQQNPESTADMLQPTIETQNQALALAEQKVNAAHNELQSLQQKLFPASPATPLITSTKFVALEQPQQPLKSNQTGFQTEDGTLIV